MFLIRCKKLSIQAVCIFVCFSLQATGRTLALERLKNSYPDHIQIVLESDLIWTDSTIMPIGNFDPSRSLIDKLNNPSLADQLEQPEYISGESSNEPQDDPGRIRYEPFFRKMYGDSPNEVEEHLEKIAWMPKVFGEGARTLRVTKINNIHEKIKRISEELEDLVLQYPEYMIFLDNPGGTYCWRNIANTDRLSNHSFGMTLDINASKSQYWQWDLKKEGRLVSEEAQLTYRNTVPWKIVQIFEKYGFIWGGKWYHYDTMHFEYRPELMTVDKAKLLPTDLINEFQ